MPNCLIKDTNFKLCSSKRSLITFASPLTWSRRVLAVRISLSTNLQTVLLSTNLKAMVSSGWLYDDCYREWYTCILFCLWWWSQFLAWLNWVETLVFLSVSQYLSVKNVIILQLHDKYWKHLVLWNSVFFNFTEGVHIHTCWSGWGTNWECLLGALLSRTWYVWVAFVNHHSISYSLSIIGSSPGEWSRNNTCLIYRG